jgi:hypothetical protein
VWTTTVEECSMEQTRGLEVTGRLAACCHWAMAATLLCENILPPLPKEVPGTCLHTYMAW